MNLPAVMEDHDWEQWEPHGPPSARRFRMERKKHEWTLAILEGLELDRYLHFGPLRRRLRVGAMAVHPTQSIVCRRTMSARRFRSTKPHGTRPSTAAAAFRRTGAGFHLWEGVRFRFSPMAIPSPGLAVDDRPAVLAEGRRPTEKHLPPEAEASRRSARLLKKDPLYEIQQGLKAVIRVQTDAKETAQTQGFKDVEAAVREAVGIAVGDYMKQLFGKKVSERYVESVISTNGPIRDALGIPQNATFSLKRAETRDRSGRVTVTFTPEFDVKNDKGKLETHVGVKIVIRF